MSLFSKLTGLNDKPLKNQINNQTNDAALDLENEKDEIDFFSKVSIKKKNEKAIDEKPNKKITGKKKTIKDEEETDAEWSEQTYEEGELSIDIYQEKNDIVVKSTIAGVKPEDIDISVNNDMLTIRGKREHEETIDEKNYYYKECYWGNFSRSIILPCEVKTDKITAKLKNGVLTVKLPKSKEEKKVAIKVVEE